MDRQSAMILISLVLFVLVMICIYSGINLWISAPVVAIYMFHYIFILHGKVRNSDSDYS